MKGVREVSRFMMPTLLGGILVLGVGIFAASGPAFALRPAPSQSDFTLSQGTATILQDTDTCGLNPGDPPNVESCNDSNSDAFEVNARLTIRGASDFLTDLRGNNVSIFLAPGDCASLDLTYRGGFPDGTFTAVIPAGSLKSGDSFHGKTLSFKGAVPDSTLQTMRFSATPVHPALGRRALDFGGLEFTVTLPWYMNPRGSSIGSISVLGNGNLCSMTGPMAFVLSIGQPLTPENDQDSASDAASSDVACVDIPAPTIHSLDLTAITCLRAVADSPAVK